MSMNTPTPEINKEIKKLESIISEQKAAIHRLKTIIDELPGSIYWKDRNGVYLGCNAFAMSKMRSVNLPWQAIVGKTDFDLFPTEVAEQYRKHDQKIMQAGIETSNEESVILPSGEKLVQLSNKRPLRNEQGEIIGIIGNTVDITYLKKIEAELLEEKRRAEKSNQAKTELIRHMEHDIRTPFNGIWILAEMLETKETDEHKRKHLGDISKSAKELLDYCNNILDFVKTEAGVTPIIAKKFDLPALIKSVIAMETVAAKIKNLSLTYEYSDKVPGIVIGDPNRIQRILLNLISNSIKFTEAGYIKISVNLAQRIDKKNMILYLTVEDTGIGFPIEEQAFFYERIYDFTSLSSTGYKGYGLGLPMVKLLIKELEGEIDLKSEPGKGTQFICTLPVGVPLINILTNMEG